MAPRHFMYRNHVRGGGAWGSSSRELDVWVFYMRREGDIRSYKKPSEASDAASAALLQPVAACNIMDGVVPPTVTHAATICGVPTRIVLTAYSNRIMVVVTQNENMGTLLLAQNDNPMSASGACYSVRVLLGKRDDEDIEVYARTLIELITKRAPDAGSLLLAISIKEHSPEMFRGVLREIEEHRVW